MKFRTIASLCVATTFGTAQQAGTTLDNLMSLVAQVQEELMMLSAECAAKDDEVASLSIQLRVCEGATSDEGAADDDAGAGDDETGTPEPGDDDTSIPESALLPAPQLNPEPHPEPTQEPTDEPTREPAPESTLNPRPTPEPIPEPPAPTLPVGDRDFTFSIGQSWNYNLDSPWNIDEVNVDVYFIDMNIGQPAIDELHARGKGVVCYISIGTWEDWREDKDNFPSDAMGNDVSGWGGEKWLDINHEQVRQIMSARVLKAASMNCDAVVKPDHMMTAYEGSGTGIDVSVAQQIEYNTWFAGEVHAAGMSVGLKNAVEMVKDVVDYFDFVLNESCHVHKMCSDYTDTFLAQGKPVFNVEYDFDTTICDEANKLGIDTILKDYDIKAPFCSCTNPSLNYECMH
ncbi:unnamed protein product, partial [Pylaiella littoralis]